MIGPTSLPAAGRRIHVVDEHAVLRQHFQFFERFWFLRIPDVSDDVVNFHGEIFQRFRRLTGSLIVAAHRLTLESGSRITVKSSVCYVFTKLYNLIVLKTINNFNHLPATHNERVSRTKPET